jgi:hydroxyethylthiazole kinase-like sugar kinase family protein
MNWERGFDPGVFGVQPHLHCIVCGCVHGALFGAFLETAVCHWMKVLELFGWCQLSANTAQQSISSMQGIDRLYCFDAVAALYVGWRMLQHGFWIDLELSL